MIFRVSEIYWPERAREDLPEDAIAEIDYQILRDELPSSEDYIKIDKLLRSCLKKTFGAEPVTFDWSPDEDATEPAPVHKKPKKKKLSRKEQQLKTALRSLDFHTRKELSLGELRQLRELTVKIMRDVETAVSWSEPVAIASAGDLEAAAKVKTYLGNAAAGLSQILRGVDSLIGTSGKEDRQ